MFSPTTSQHSFSVPPDSLFRTWRKRESRNGKERVVKRVGDVMYDSILYYSKLADKKSTILRI